MKNDKRWNREMKRYRIIEHELRGESVFTVEWNDRWFFGIWGRWYDTFHTKSLEYAIKKIHRLVKYKLNK
jgi:hypothetical protein